MTLCSSNITANPIPACVTILTIGTVSNLSASLYVFFKDTTTGRKIRLSGSSNGAGLVTVDLTAITFPVNHAYIITVATQAAPQTELNVTIGASTQAEIFTRFEQVFDSAGVLIAAAAFTLTGV